MEVVEYIKDCEEDLSDCDSNFGLAEIFAAPWPWVLQQHGLLFSKAASTRSQDSNAPCQLDLWHADPKWVKDIERSALNDTEDDEISACFGLDAGQCWHVSR